jgi:WD40 repeat protein
VFTLSWTSGGIPTDQGGLGLLASGGGDGKIIIWQITRREEGITMEPVAAMKEAHGVSDVNNVAWCKREDGKGVGMVASCGDDGSVKVWRVVSD